MARRRAGRRRSGGEVCRAPHEPVAVECVAERWTGAPGGASFLRLWFFFNDTATTEIYPLSLHDALPISIRAFRSCCGASICRSKLQITATDRSEERFSRNAETDIVCRLLREKRIAP